MTLTILRDSMYKVFSGIELKGEVLDLGGTRDASYHTLFAGSKKFTTANIAGERDIDCNLEEKIPINDAKFDTVILINLLEHIYNTDLVLHEIFRVLTPGGMVVIAVPFLIQIHPSPRDHWRFTGETLQMLLAEVGFSNIYIKEVGTGPFGACAQLLHGVLHFDILRFISVLIARLLDAMLHKIDRKGSYGVSRYPLAYVVTATKPVK